MKRYLEVHRRGINIDRQFWQPRIDIGDRSNLCLEMNEFRRTWDLVMFRNESVEKNVNIPALMSC